MSASYFVLDLPRSIMAQLSKTEQRAARKRFDAVFADAGRRNRFSTRDEAVEARAGLVDFGLDARAVVAESLDF